MYLIITTFINYVIAHNHCTHLKLLTHQGKIILIDSDIIQMYLLIMPDGFIENIEKINTDIIPTVIMRIKLTDIPLILINFKYIFSYIQIEGDIEFANIILQISKSLRWDIEYELSRIVGDIVATQIMCHVNCIIKTIKIVYQKLVENFIEYFVEEQLILVPSITLREFANNIVKLHDDYARLLQRIEKLGH